MGFGSGYSSRTDRGGKRYSNDMVAHVWNAQSAESGQSGNGNFYFRGAELFSYGSHYLVGAIMPDGVALLNASSYSVSTSGHSSDARGAVRNRARFEIQDLTALGDLLRDIRTGRVDKERARRTIREHAEALGASRKLEAGESRWRWNSETNQAESLEAGETAGAYLTRLCKLPAASWPKLAREAAKLKADKAKAEAKAEAERQRGRALRLADASDSDFRRALAIDSDGRTYDAPRRLAELARELFGAVRLAKRLGFSARRRATLSKRHKQARERLAAVESLVAIVERRARTRAEIRTLRAAESIFSRLIRDGMAPSFNDIRNLEYAATAAHGLAGRDVFPARSRNRLEFAAKRMKATAERLEDERRIEAERVRLAERRAYELKLEQYESEWRNGTAPNGRRFDSEHGGAAIRVRGALLETSHGASVPLADAIRVFRFIKLVMQRGQPWRRNGQRIAVGAFQVDSIEVSGAFVAGCHSFAWQEVESAARAAGVFDQAPSDSAVHIKESANA